MLGDYRIVQTYYDNVYMKAQIMFALSVKYNLSKRIELLNKMFLLAMNIDLEESIVLEIVIKSLKINI